MNENAIGVGIHHEPNRFYKHNRSGFACIIILRLLLVPFLLSILFINPVLAGMYSWIDENGVRHYSNVDNSKAVDNSKTMVEYKDDTSNKTLEEKERNRFEVLRMYKEEDRKLQEKLERDQNDKLERKKRALLAKKLKQCEDAQSKLERLKRLGWEKFDGPEDPICRSREKGVRKHPPKGYEESNACRRKTYERRIRELQRELQYACY